jgi:Rod binding domain-containing protein
MLDAIKAAQTQSTLSPKKLDAIEKSAKEFEGMFLSEMVSHMFDTVAVDPMFGGGEGEETWRGMLVDEYSKHIVQNGGIGLSDAIKIQMIQMQEAADK